MAELKTKENDASVDAFLESVTDVHQQEDSKKLRVLFEEISGYPAKMWGNSIIGFGSQHYKSKSGREGDWMMTGFSPRKNTLSIYLLDSYEFEAHKDLLEKLGPHKTSKSCLYIKRLEDVDMDVVQKIIERSVDRVKAGEYLS
jgi:hypothetical protein